jgi:hypothetical protein
MNKSKFIDVIVKRSPRPRTRIMMGSEVTVNEKWRLKYLLGENGGGGIGLRRVRSHVYERLVLAA